MTKQEKAKNTKLTIHLDGVDLYAKRNETMEAEIAYYCANSTWDGEKWTLVDTNEYIRKDALINSLKKRGWKFI